MLMNSNIQADRGYSLSYGTVSPCLNRLQALGLVDRLAHGGSGRISWTFRLTNKGKLWLGSEAKRLKTLVDQVDKLL